MSTVLSNYASATVWHVDTNGGSDTTGDGLTRETAFATIQKGITTAAPDDTVLVWPGVYDEETSFLGKAITVTAADDPPVIACGVGVGVTFNQGEDPNSILEHFIIRGCSSDGIRISWSEPTLRHITSTENGSGIDVETVSSPHIVNSIFWNNSHADIEGEASTINMSYCCYGTTDLIASDIVGEGNVTEDPLFAVPLNQDYHLKSQMGRWNRVLGLWHADAVDSPGVDTGDPNSDWSAELWPHGFRINMGAYGGTSQASMSVLQNSDPADFNHDDMINLQDFSRLSVDWLLETDWLASDIDRNGIVDSDDLLNFSDVWLWEVVYSSAVTDKQVYVMGETIVVDFTNAGGYILDWIGICKKGATIAPNSSAMKLWALTDGTQGQGTPGIIDGTLTFTQGITEESGEYEVRMFIDPVGTDPNEKNYDIRARHFFTVE
ncbi:MAG: hypothetical protein JW860_11020 [Sedimentisphaerales bacterium]|nr:hypothetical protein [Sedimentisphaerales bacterium]